MRVASLVMSLSLLAGNCFTQSFWVGGGYTVPISRRLTPEIKAAIQSGRSFSLPGLRSTEIFAESVVSANDAVLRLGHVTLSTTDLHVEAEEVAYDWTTLKATLTGAKILPQGSRREQ